MEKQRLRYLIQPKSTLSVLNVASEFLAFCYIALNYTIHKKARLHNTKRKEEGRELIDMGTYKTMESNSSI
jgi:hypothetical protein